MLIDKDSIFKVIKVIEEECLINIAIIDDEDIIIESYDVWFDNDLGLYCLQDLYIVNGIVEEIGSTSTYTKYEFERELNSFLKIGRLIVGNP